MFLQCFRCNKTMGRSGYEITSLWSIEDAETPLSICSADTPKIEEDHPLFQLKDSFLQVVMAAYMQVGGRDLDEGTQAIDTTETPCEPADPEHNARRKRSRLSDSASTATGEKKSQRVPTKRRAQDRRLLFACPYAKKDPVQYRDCYRYFLTRVRDVKQHLTRCHRKPIYCPICNETFEDEDKKDSHIRARGCTERPSVIIEGISESQKRRLSQKADPTMSESQQWFVVYDTLFSPHPRPKTPYRDRELSEDLCVFQDFMAARGPSLLANFLETKGATTSHLPHEERDLDAFNKEILGEGLQLIIEQWTSDSAAASHQSSVPHSRRSSRRSSPTIDSGIAMQISHPPTVDEGHQAGNSSVPDLTMSHLDDERHEDGNQYSFDFSSRTSYPRLGESLQQHPSSSVDNSTEWSADVSFDSSQDRTFAMSQFTSLLEYPGSTFPSTINNPDMLSFDTEWPS
ncbi:hypothetical protein GGR54DRAFT_434027 [Hypoxylon sp. NC1633]|nr:hypothetical protein GGR54DRAFT_434027 [Hypoxylon sp. NC1633]